MTKKSGEEISAENQLAKIRERVEMIRPIIEAASRGYRTSDHAQWFGGIAQEGEGDEGRRVPAVVVCEHPGNLIAQPTYGQVAQFKKREDVNAVVALHSFALDLLEGRL